MTCLEDWPDAPLLRGDRIVLEPLREDHAVEMAPLLGDAALHIFIGGEPLTSAQLMSAWLRSQGVMTLVAHIHPDHAASQAVARSIGLAPTTTLHDGEVRWQG